MILGWLAELESTIAIQTPHLHTLAVECIVHDSGRVIIFTAGQAAQLEGDMVRPVYTWNNPAPDDVSSYDVHS